MSTHTLLHRNNSLHVPFMISSFFSPRSRFVVSDSDGSPGSMEGWTFAWMLEHGMLSSLLLFIEVDFDVILREDEGKSVNDWVRGMICNETNNIAKVNRLK